MYPKFNSFFLIQSQIHTSDDRPILPAEPIPEIVPSQRNQPLRVHNGCRFRFIRLNKDGRFEWRCNENVKCGCKLVTSTALPYTVIPGSETEHDHVRPTQEQIDAMRVRYNIRRRASSSTLDPTSHIITQSSTGFNLEVQDFLPSERALQRTAQRHRAASSSATDAIRTLTLFDTGVHNSSRIIILGRRNFLDQIQRYRHLAADGTFASAPTGFHQLFTIHFFVDVFHNGQPRIKSIPALYCLLPNRLQRTYIRLFEEVQRLVPNLRPETFLADFESASRNAFRNVFHGARINGCFFHLMQSLLKRVCLRGLYSEHCINRTLSAPLKSVRFRESPVKSILKQL